MWTFIGTAASAVVTAVLGSLLWEKKLKLWVRSKRLENANDPDFAAMLDLYTAQFPDEEANYSSDDLESLLPTERGFERRKHVRCVDILLVAKNWNTVVGYLFCHYYPADTRAIVSYCGHDDSEAAKSGDAIGKQLKHLRTILREQNPVCTGVIFEVQNKQLGRTFRRRARLIESEAKQLLFDYRRPKYCLEAKTEGDILNLFWADISITAGGVVRKELVMKILETLHLSGYGDFYEPTDPRHNEYQAYLRDRLESYRATLPDPVPTAS